MQQSQKIQITIYDENEQLRLLHVYEEKEEKQQQLKNQKQRKQTTDNITSSQSLLKKQESDTNIKFDPLPSEKIKSNPNNHPINSLIQKIENNHSPRHNKLVKKDSKIDIFNMQLQRSQSLNVGDTISTRASSLQNGGFSKMCSLSTEQRDNGISLKDLKTVNNTIIEENLSENNLTQMNQSQDSNPGKILLISQSQQSQQQQSQQQQSQQQQQNQSEKLQEKEDLDLEQGPQDTPITKLDLCEGNMIESEKIIRCTQTYNQHQKIKKSQLNQQIKQSKQESSFDSSRLSDISLKQDKNQAGSTERNTQIQQNQGDQTNKFSDSNDKFDITSPSNSETKKLIRNPLQSQNILLKNPEDTNRSLEKTNDLELPLKQKDTQQSMTQTADTSNKLIVQGGGDTPITPRQKMDFKEKLTHEHLFIKQQDLSPSNKSESDTNNDMMMRTNKQHLTYNFPFRGSRNMNRRQSQFIQGSMIQQDQMQKNIKRNSRKSSQQSRSKSPSMTCLMPPPPTSPRSRSKKKKQSQQQQSKKSNKIKKLKQDKKKLIEQNKALGRQVKQMGRQINDLDGKLDSFSNVYEKMEGQIGQLCGLVQNLIEENKELKQKSKKDQVLFNQKLAKKLGISMKKPQIFNIQKGGSRIKQESFKSFMNLSEKIHNLDGLDILQSFDQETILKNDKNPTDTPIDSNNNSNSLQFPDLKNLNINNNKNINVNNEIDQEKEEIQVNVDTPINTGQRNKKGSTETYSTTNNNLDLNEIEEVKMEQSYQISHQYLKQKTLQAKQKQQQQQQQQQVDNSSQFLQQDFSLDSDYMQQPDLTLKDLKKKKK